MAKQHDMIIKRLLANYLEYHLTPRGEGIITDLDTLGIMHSLHKDEMNKLIAAGNKELSKLKKASAPLGSQMKNWLNELS